MHEITNSDEGKIIAVIRSHTLYFEMEFISQLEFEHSKQINTNADKMKQISPQMHDNCVAIFFSFFHFELK